MHTRKITHIVKTQNRKQFIKHSIDWEYQLFVLLSVERNLCQDLNSFMKIQCEG